MCIAAPFLLASQRSSLDKLSRQENCNFMQLPQTAQLPGNWISFCGGFQPQPDLYHSLSWIGGASVVNLIVRQVGTPAAQFGRAQAPDVLPCGLHNLSDWSLFRCHDRVLTGSDGRKGHALRKPLDRRNRRAEQVVVLAVFIALIVGIDNAKALRSQVGNLGQKIFREESLPQRTDLPLSGKLPRIA